MLINGLDAISILAFSPNTLMSVSNHNIIISYLRLSAVLTANFMKSTRFYYENEFNNTGAQCSPRHACPLNGALLMHLHEWTQAAAGLARERVLRGLKRMQNHAPDACMAVSAKMAGFSGIFFRATGRPVQRV